MSKSKKTVSKKTTTTKKPAAKESAANKNQTQTKSENKSFLCSLLSCNKVRCTIILVIIAILSLLLFKNFSSNKNAAISTVGEVEEVVANWIANNPELILESVINMQKKQAEKQLEEAGQNISNKLNDLYKRDIDPAVAPKNHDVAVIEFFDYNCGYCKRAVPTIEKLIAQDKKVKVIFKELPILGKSSEDLAKVSLAFNMLAPSRYFNFHNDLMKSKARTTEEAIAIAAKHGTTKEKIQKVLAKFDDKISKEIAFNRQLANSIGVNGTPAFLVGETLIPGAVGLSTLREEIKKERNK